MRLAVCRTKRLESSPERKTFSVAEGRTRRATECLKGRKQTAAQTVVEGNDPCGVSWGSCGCYTSVWDVGNGLTNDPRRSRVGSGEQDDVRSQQIRSSICLDAKGETYVLDTDYVLGLVDGEGCFAVHLNRSPV